MKLVKMIFLFFVLLWLIPEVVGTIWDKIADWYDKSHKD